MRRLAAGSSRRGDRDRARWRRRAAPGCRLRSSSSSSDGSGWVSGANGEREAIQAGEAVLWDPGEEHESGSEEGMTALVVEAESLDV